MDGDDRVEPEVGSVDVDARGRRLVPEHIATRRLLVAGLADSQPVAAIGAVAAMARGPHHRHRERSPAGTTSNGAPLALGRCHRRPPPAGPRARAGSDRSRPGRTMPSPTCPACGSVTSRYGTTSQTASPAPGSRRSCSTTWRDVPAADGGGHGGAQRRRRADRIDEIASGGSSRRRSCSTGTPRSGAPTTLSSTPCSTPASTTS